MITNDSDYEVNGLPGDLFDGLEQLAHALDAERYPGPAWSPAVVPRPRRRSRRVAVAWKMAAGFAAAAGIALAAITLRPAPEPPAALPPATGRASGELPEPDQLPVKQQDPAAGPVALAGNAPLRNEQAISESEAAESDRPQIVVVEDLDSYSLIDMSGSAPVVSFMTKDASILEYPVPVPLGSQVPGGTSDRML